MTDFSDTAPRIARASGHAKLNLVLRVLAREASGFHTLETLFQGLELSDVVDIELAEHERGLTCHGPAMPAAGLGRDGDNLATRAAVAYTNATRWDTGWHITVEKNIPVGGGLGGGSADAAAVLRALESLSPHPLGLDTLMELGGTLGSDVPFLLSGAPLAWAWNRGDRLLPLPPLPRMDVVLVTFSDGVNTAAAYGALAGARELALQHTLVANAPADQQQVHRKHPAAAQYPADAFASWSSVVGLAVNDFEGVVPAMHAGVARWLPVVRQAARRLTDNGTPAIGLMSGSGATCFVLAPRGMVPDLGAVPGVSLVNTGTLTAVSSL